MAPSLPVAGRFVTTVRLATVGTLLAGCVVSAVLFSVLYASEHARSSFDFERRTQARLASVALSFDGAADAMRAANLLLASVPGISDA